MTMSIGNGIGAGTGTDLGLGLGSGAVLRTGISNNIRFLYQLLVFALLVVLCMFVVVATAVTLKMNTP